MKNFDKKKKYIFCYLNFIKKKIVEQIVKFFLKDSPNYFIKSNDKITSSLIANGVHEEIIIKFIKDSTKKNRDFLLDIGSNIGLISCEVGNYFKYVEMYEPNPICFNVLKSNALIHLKENYQIREYALGEDSQIKSMMIPKNNFGGAYIKSKFNKYPTNFLLKKDGFKKAEKNYINLKINVKSAKNEFKRLFVFLKKNNLKRGVVKIDTEGYEHLIIDKIIGACPKDFNLIIIFELWGSIKEYIPYSLNTKHDISIYHLFDSKKFKLSDSFFKKIITMLSFKKRNFFINEIKDDLIEGDIVMFVNNK